MARFVIVLRDALPDFSRRHTYHRISRVVVVGRATENLHSQNSLLKVYGFALQSLLDQITKQAGIAFAALECRAVEHSVQLCQNL